MHSNAKLQSHYNKYGADDLKFMVVEEIPINKLMEIEQFYLDVFRPWFNISPNAYGQIGFRHSNETKALLGYISKGNKYCLGYKHTDETKKKMSEAGKGKPKSEAFKQKCRDRGISASMKEAHALYSLNIPDDIRQKMSASKKKMVFSIEHRRKIGEANSRRVITEATRAKLKTNNLGKHRVYDADGSYHYEK